VNVAALAADHNLSYTHGDPNTLINLYERVAVLFEKPRFVFL